MRLPQRQCLILLGQPDWLVQQALSLYHQSDEQRRCWLSDHNDRPDDALGHKQALQQLGQDNRLIVFDGRDHFHADAFGTLVGSLQAGGLMLILLDQDSSASPWLQRFLNIAAGNSAIRLVRQPESLPAIKFPDQRLPASVTPTAEQQQAIAAVIRVVKGHRRRPLVISADRGRGKSALLGMAAAQLLRQGKQRILVTAPSVDNIQPLLEHAAAQLDAVEKSRYRLDWQQAEITFIAPDALLNLKPATDLLIIDEAAAIPAAMLSKMLTQYSRIVFATTLHGYEGTGRGFASRFQSILQQQTPDWKALHLQQPVRWAEDDALEQFSFDALLLDAEPADERQLAGAQSDKPEFALIDRAQLADDERLLREVFGLMVLAHYRTRPSDLQMLLDRDDITVAVLRHRSHIVASAWLVAEPALSAPLSKQVFAGRRRLPGQLLPQSLLFHVGLSQAGQFHYQRIIRIAVHPALQHQGLGSELVRSLDDWAQRRCDLLGTSFAMETAVTRFWLSNGFTPVRLGQHRDEVTGSHALILLKAMNGAGAGLLAQAADSLSRQWPFLLQTQLADMAVEDVVQLSVAIGLKKPELNQDECLQIRDFAEARRALTSSLYTLRQWLLGQLTTARFRQLEPLQQQLLVMLLLQQRSIETVARQINAAGQAGVEKMLRQAVLDCWPSDSSLETR
jgi:tRNA(Met) cytidine acetyltransferase